MKTVPWNYLLFCFLFFQSLFSFSVYAENAEYDVIIYGGTSGGVTAAVQAARMGKSVAIISPDKHLGGLSSAGLGNTDSGVRDSIGGLSREFYHRVWLAYQDPKNQTWQKKDQEGNRIPFPGQDNNNQLGWCFEPHIAESIFDTFVQENNIPVFRGEFLDRENGVTMTDNAIQSITTLSGKTFLGKIFIDATYEGDLMAAAHVPYTTGRESNATYNETLNGIQTQHAVYHQFPGPVDPYKISGNPSSGLLPFVNPDVGGKDGDGDDKIQAYNLRLCLTSNPENRLEFTEPENYNPDNYELLLRSLEVGQPICCSFSEIPNQKTDTNNDLAVSTDYIGANYRYPEASYVERQEIYQAHRDWIQGLFWTLKTNPRVPEKIRKLYVINGLSKDEFKDTDNWPFTLYVREARRMVSDFVVTERHLRRQDPTPHSIGMGSYNMDSHHVQRYVALDENGRPVVRNEGDVEVNPGGPYPIDYGAIVPPAGNCVNLLVPVCVSSSHIAYGSIRMEPVFMILGQSAATAAVLAIDHKIAVQDVDYPQLRERLLADHQILDYKPGIDAVEFVTKHSGILIDDQQAGYVGEWNESRVVSPFMEYGYRHDLGTQDGEKSATFSTTIESPGDYEVFISYTTNGNRATNVPVEIIHQKGTTCVTVNEQKNPEFANLFHSLGTFTFDEKATVTVSNRDVNGHVIVDAVWFLKR